MATLSTLPDEILLHILSFLEVGELVRCQHISRRFLVLCRDDGLWKLECFNASRAESRRRRQQTETINPQLAALRDAFSGIVPRSNARENESESESGRTRDAIVQRTRALVNWDPSYVDEQVNYYEEYIHRHAPISIGWLRIPDATSHENSEPCEATGVGLLHSSGSEAQHVVAPLDDGSVCIWDIRARQLGEPLTQGEIMGRSTAGLLTGAGLQRRSLADVRAMMTEVGAVESVSIDSHNKRGYFARNNMLMEVDLSTLELVSEGSYSFPITAVSTVNHGSLVVGTNQTIHIHDPRNKARSEVDPSLTVEVIGGPTASHALLSQPGPLSILDRPEDESIWVAGRFTHLLNYDRRFFPRLRGSIHSGARISCLTSLPHPYIPRWMNLLHDPRLSIADLHAARSVPGTTLLAAGEYKGKGSLELYNLASTPSDPSHLATHAYQNRQTASATKLLAATPHGCSFVCADGDGTLKWFERDASTPIRTFNINDASCLPASVSGSAGSASMVSQQQTQLIHDPTTHLPYAPVQEDSTDIVQKLLPLHYPASPAASPQERRIDVNQPSLLLKTGDGRLGVLAYSPVDPLHTSAATAVARDEAEERERESAMGNVEKIERRARKDAERSYADSLRRALQRQADDARFLGAVGFQRWAESMGGGFGRER